MEAMMKPKITIYLEQTVYDNFHVICGFEKTSLSSFINSLIEQEINKYNIKVEKKLEK